MKKRMIRLNHTLFDIAAGPTLLALFGIPALLVVAVVVLVAVAVRLIVKAHKKNQAEQSKRDNDLPQ